MFLPHFRLFCDLLLNGRTATWNLLVLYNNESFFISKSFKIARKPAFQCPTFARFGEHEKRPFDVIYYEENEAISLVTMRSKEFWLVLENHATVKPDSSVSRRGMKTHSESRNEVRNLQILKKILEKSSQFLSSEQPCEPKCLDAALNIAGVEKIPTKNLPLR